MDVDAAEIAGTTLEANRRHPIHPTQTDFTPRTETPFRIPNKMDADQRLLPGISTNSTVEGMTMHRRISTGKGAKLAAALVAAGALLTASDVQAQRATDRFELRSAPRMALHYFLLSWATDVAGQWPGWAVPIRERSSWRGVLSEPDARRWATAIETYSAAVGRDLLFDQGLIAVRDRLAGEAYTQVPESDMPLLEAVESVLPLYLSYWWPAHDRRNQAWIESLVAILERVEEDVVTRLEAAYGRSWPERRIPIDVVPYTHPLGAYSTAARVVISSSDPDLWMPQAAEIVFHEASHLGALEQGIKGGLRVAFEGAGKELPERLWHDMIFYTTGESVRLALEVVGQPGYRHYKTPDYENHPHWRALVPVFEEYWRPFLESRSDAPGERRRALDALARALAEAEVARRRLVDTDRGAGEISVPSEQSNIGGACSDPAFRAFDYWIAEWDVYNASDSLIGHSTGPRVADGCAVQDSWRPDGDGNRGVCLNSLDPADGTWCQHWVGGGDRSSVSPDDARSERSCSEANGIPPRIGPGPAIVGPERRRGAALGDLLERA